ncbi:MAG: aminotransferase class I/II-fold pyridoxal phosphate-dependent enzyme [Bryobacterales bacterium]|nr:aminotransferase class I/II-fold pyridoxal phosphate-dependent enzyme [Bryobacteraceae bacterium]MDW8129795.1 aminotransferase class I/II-fold pyridoxal phosphate-dependent enzyme [Bryobacterales bacterium]
MSAIPQTAVGQAVPPQAAWEEAFRLRPAKGAVVSEISEATAAAPVPPAERVNFHIGNPVEDPRLVELYARIALGLDVGRAAATEDLAGALLHELGWPQQELPALEFLVAAIRRSGPYLPRGGFLRNKPDEVVRRFTEWLGGQSEPLSYDLGESSGRREIILATGGVAEVLRVFFHGLSRYLARLPAWIFLYGFRPPAHLRGLPGLRFVELPEPEAAAFALLEQSLIETPASPSFLLLGHVPSEEARRALRRLSRDHPLFVIEANDAPNHASLAREARMMNRTLRLLTPAVFAPELAALSLVFVAGYHEFVALIERMHFELKGTPSAAEVELLAYLLRRPRAPAPPAGDGSQVLYGEKDLRLAGFQRQVLAAVAVVGDRLSRLAGQRVASWEKRLADAVERSADRLARLARSPASVRAPRDPLEGLAFRDILGALPERAADLAEAFRAAFLRHHPEYDPEATIVVSGSARTALGLLGFHCGIGEAIVPDLSWTYEHCFPEVTSVPLAAGFELDVDGILAAVDERLRSRPGWRDCGAVVLNNPHNATGQVFAEEDIRRLLLGLLERGVFVIDDLSYENVAPSHELAGPPTARQMADELVRSGRLSREQASRVVTVHSLSKTDCLAGARLCVVEIRDAALRQRFLEVNSAVAHNLGALLLGYLFYRATAQSTHTYWRMRNAILDERMCALEQAARNLPAERNPFGISVVRPRGSMYPRLVVESLPAGISLDWIASRLARQGVGLIPLSTFARTEQGIEVGRKSFRLTLGGADDAERLLTKTRRVLIDLNRIIAEEQAHYSRRMVELGPPLAASLLDHASLWRTWRRFEERLARAFAERFPAEARRMRLPARPGLGWMRPEEFFHARVECFRSRFRDRLELAEHRLRLAGEREGRALAELLEQELQPDRLDRRQAHFRERISDRTVHPTQMYSLEAELEWEKAIAAILDGGDWGAAVEPLARGLAREYLGLNVAIPSRAEGDELLLDLAARIAAEDLLRFRAGIERREFLSYWGDWDGSNRPSGQGHHLVATVLMANVEHMGRLLELLMDAVPGLKVDPALVSEIRRLPETGRGFRALFDEINQLTHQLERRYRGLLPWQLRPGALRKLGMRLHLARDPVVVLWEHNDRLERRMLELRRRRRRMLEQYFRLNAALRDCLRSNLAAVRQLRQQPGSALVAASFRDLLSRVVITPRIHQNMITSADPFAVDTTAYNLTEINEIAGRHGNPGMVLALQVSMATEPEALIALDRKLRARREEALRAGAPEVPPIWLIPLFEHLEKVRGIPAYLDKLWEYAVQSRRLNQTPEQRLAEMVCEIFIAGSDLSQEVGQTAALLAFRQAKYAITLWLAGRGLVGQVRVKMGAGEPMQRQGCYYAPISGRPAFLPGPDGELRLSQSVGASAKRSAQYAVTPLLGVFAACDLTTFQSNLSERLRHLPAAELAQVLHHVREAQQFHSADLRRAAEPLTETRLRFAHRGQRELERLTLGPRDELLEEFARLSTENFRHILYGREDDVVGIYAISYFIARTLPQLRDRPQVRPASGPAGLLGQRILERIAATIPFCRYGSSLRAIAHNQAQTFVLGVNQVTTGLFRSLDWFARSRAASDGAELVLADRILPHLPVYEILQSLRLYQDLELQWLWRLERAFPAGNSAFAVLREDVDAIRPAVALFQKELVRRHGLPASEFFEGDRFIPRLLPALRPDLAVLLQPDLFNTDIEALLAEVGPQPPDAWRREVERLLAIPARIRELRASAWELLFEPIFERVSRFVELATALHSVARRHAPGEAPSAAAPTLRQAMGYLRSTHEDSLQQFLLAAFEYLSAPLGALELPTNLVRAMKKDVERLVRIEEQALPARQQDLLRFYLLEIARLAGENG